jgi:hypothetical protein
MVLFARVHTCMPYYAFTARIRVFLDYLITSEFGLFVSIELSEMVPNILCKICSGALFGCVA